MTSHAGRLYGLAAALFAFFVLWAAIAAHPWAASTTDPRLVALAQRERRLRADAVLVHQIVSRRLVDYHRVLAKRRAEIVAAKAAPSAPAPAAVAPNVRIVTLPPLVITRTS